MGSNPQILAARHKIWRTADTGLPGFADLLRSEDMADYEDVAIRILRLRFRRALRLIDDGMTPVEAVARCEKQLRLAIYDTNEAVSAPDLMAA